MDRSSMPTTPVTQNTIVPELLNYKNYEQWSLRLETYMLAENLWDVVKPATETTPEDPQPADQDIKNAKALFAIQNSCGSDMFSCIRNIRYAKCAWETLKKECMKKQKAEEHAKKFELYKPFADYVIAGDWENAKYRLTKLPDAITAIDGRRGYDDTALHLATRGGHLHIVKELKLLMKPEYLRMKNANGSTALHTAVKMGLLDIVKELVPLMGEIQDTCGDIPLHKAVYFNNAKIVKELVRLMRREDLDIKNNAGCTALDLAVKMENMPILKEFLPYDDFSPNIPFTDYVTKGDWENAKMCLTQLEPYSAVRARDPRDGHQNTALHVASREGYVDIVRELVLLMAQELDYEVKNANGDPTFDEGASAVEKTIHMVLKKEKMLSGVLELKNASGDTALHEAVSGGHLDIVKELMPSMRQEGFEVRNAKGLIALHIAVKIKHKHIVRELVSSMRSDALEIKDNEGYTALGFAVKEHRDGDEMDMIRDMVQKNKKLLLIGSPSSNHVPVSSAISWTKRILSVYLYSSTPPEALNGEKGAELIMLCIKRMQSLDIAGDLLRRYPKLAFVGVWGPAMTLARMRYAFLSGEQLKFWEKWIYHCINIQRNSDFNTDDVLSGRSFFKRLAKALILTPLGINRIYKIKAIHLQFLEFLQCMGEASTDDLTEAETKILKQSIFKAIENGHVEFVTRMCKENPRLVEIFDEKSRSIFQFAIECRQEKVYSLFYGLEREKQKWFVRLVAKSNNNMLHSAGSLAPLLRLNRIPGPSLQMQRELQWFKEVESILPCSVHESLNHSADGGLTARQVFTDNHKKLMEDAEASIKKTASSCTVVAALIATMMFAATITIPGGNNEELGLPIFIDNNLFLIFIISDTLSLLFSTTSVIIFLGLLTSRYAEEDFLISLPRKMMIGLFTLFVSIATMMIVYSSALIMMLQGKHSWIVVPSIFLGCVPIASFVWVQFPLLIWTIISTYGPGIFDKKVKRWY